MQDKKDLAQHCLDIASNKVQSESEKVGVTGTWVDHVHMYEEGELKIRATFCCDGPRLLEVWYKGVNVFDTIEEEDEEIDELGIDEFMAGAYMGINKFTVHTYISGEWEQEIERIHKTIEWKYTDDIPF